MPFQNKASFTRWPRLLTEIIKLDSVENLKPFTIEKTLILQFDSFINFLTDMTVERLYLRKNHHLCRIDDEGVWHCILVTIHGYKEGILVMADNKGFPTHAALFWKKRLLGATERVNSFFPRTFSETNRSTDL